MTLPARNHQDQLLALNKNGLFMETNFNNILFLTSFCFMACDGTIASKEVALLHKLATEDHLFGDINVDEELKQYTRQLGEIGNTFIHSYLEALSAISFTKEQELALFQVAVDTILADDVVEYSEIKFFKAVRECLSLSDEDILSNIKGIEEYWIEKDVNEETAADYFMQSIDLSSFKVET